MSKRRKKARKAESRPRTDWPQILGEAVLLAVVIAVPVLIIRAATNICAVKDVALGLGVAFGLSLWLLTGLARGRLAWVSSRLNPLVIAFGLWAGISVFYSAYWYVSISEFGRLAAHIGLYWLAIAFLRRAAQARRLIGAACLSAVPVCVYAFMQAAGRDPVMWRGAADRVFSFLGNATYLASFLVLIMPLAVAAGWPSATKEKASGASSRRRTSAVVSGLFFAAAAMMAICLYLSVTMSAVLGLMLGAFFAGLIVLVRGGWGVVRRSWLWVLVAAVVVGGTTVVGYRHLPEVQQRRVQQVLHFRDPAGQERTLHWQIALDLFREHRLLGLGYGTFRTYSLERLSEDWYTDLRKSAETMLVPSYAHNEYLQVLAGTGLIGATIFLLLLAAVCATMVTVSLRHSDGRWRRIGLGTTVGLTAFLVQNVFGVTFRQTGAVTFFWLWLGVLALARGWMPAPGEQAVAPRLRELRFRPLSPPRLALAGTGLLCLLIPVGWWTVRPLKASLTLCRAQVQARIGESLPADQVEERRRYFRVAAELAEETVQLSPHSASGHYVAAYAWGQLGDYEKALTANKRALELLPGNASFEYNLGVTYLELGEPGEAEAHFRRAVELMPTNVNNLGAMAKVLLEQGRAKEALPYAEATVKLAYTDAKCHSLMADVHEQLGDLEPALRHRRQAVRFAPEDPGAWRQLTTLFLRMTRHDEAIQASRTWARLDPGSPQAYHALGMGYYGKKDYAAAKKAFSQALENDSGFLLARLYLGHCHAKAGDFEAARRELARVVDAAPASREAQMAKALLDDL